MKFCNRCNSMICRNPQAHFEGKEGGFSGRGREPWERELAQGADDTQFQRTAYGWSERYPWSR